MEEDIKKEEQTETAEESKKQEQTEGAEEITPQEQTGTAEDFGSESVESGEFEAEEFDDENEDDWEDEEPEAVKPWKMALVFCGLILAAALICAALWKFTHSDAQNQEGIEGQQPSGSAELSSTGPEGQPSAGTAEPSFADPASGDGDEAETEDRNRFVTKDGRVILFTDCDDIVSPKEYVNLRTEPSTSQGDDTVSCRLNNGENVHRTGFSADAGWSRVEYDGKELYVITSYVLVVEEQTAE